MPTWLAPITLAAFAYRCNRRFDLRDWVAQIWSRDRVTQIIVDVTQCRPVTKAEVKMHAEARF